MNEQKIKSPVKPKSKKKRRMFDFVIHAVDKVFYQVYDGEPIQNRRHPNSDNILEEEVLFCKNNVCVHVLRKTENDNIETEKRIAGYMCVKKIFRSDSVVSDLILTWIPNQLLAVNNDNADDVIRNNEHNENILSQSEELPIQQNSESEQFESQTPTSPNNLDLPKGADVFSINLLDVKTVKLFYTGSDKDSGQFVIGSHENEYKVFHFHNTGLIKLAGIFTQWNGCSADSDLDPDEVGQQVFNIIHEEVKTGTYRDGAYPEEGRFRPMNMNAWLGFVNQLGQIEDVHNFRKHVFFGGLSQEVRPDAWKYLLYYYPMHSTHKDRELLKDEKRKAYQRIHEKRLSLSGDDYEKFWREVQFTVDKDVVRTDRSHPYYAGQDNPNIQKMRNILLNYAIHNPQIGYTQGMSDLVAPVLATLHDEVDSFWCFVGLMEVSMFATTPTDDSMDKSLNYLRELLRMIVPEFYMHCLCEDYDLNLLFAHRWLVLCFKREFISHEVLKIWEACWARYQTDYFHIFICVALVSLYGDVCLEKKMNSDEILQYFTDMALKFDGSQVLKEARAILYKFRQFNRIPCSLRGLLSGAGVWDGGIGPEIECVSHHQRCCTDLAKDSLSKHSVPSERDILQNPTVNQSNNPSQKTIDINQSNSSDKDINQSNSSENEFVQSTSSYKQLSQSNSPKPLKDITEEFIDNNSQKNLTGQSNDEHIDDVILNQSDSFENAVEQLSLGDKNSEKHIDAT